MKKIEWQQTGFKTWKSGKKWLVASAVLGVVVAGGAASTVGVKADNITLKTTPVLVAASTASARPAVSAGTPTVATASSSASFATSNSLSEASSFSASSNVASSAELQVAATSTSSLAASSVAAQSSNTGGVVSTASIATSSTVSTTNKTAPLILPGMTTTIAAKSLAATSAVTASTTIVAATSATVAPTTGDRVIQVAGLVNQVINDIADPLIIGAPVGWISDLVFGTISTITKVATTVTTAATDPLSTTPLTGSNAASQSAQGTINVTGAVLTTINTYLPLAIPITSIVGTVVSHIATFVGNWDSYYGSLIQPKSN